MYYRIYRGLYIAIFIQNTYSRRHRTDLRVAFSSNLLVTKPVVSARTRSKLVLLRWMAYQLSEAMKSHLRIPCHDLNVPRYLRYSFQLLSPNIICSPNPTYMDIPCSWKMIAPQIFSIDGFKWCFSSQGMKKVHSVWIASLQRKCYPGHLNALQNIAWLNATLPPKRLNRVFFEGGELLRRLLTISVLIRQMALSTKNGHTSSLIESRKSYLSV